MKNYELKHQAYRIYNKYKLEGLCLSVVPGDCEKCNRRVGEEGIKIIVAHHEDYARPLDVIWLCGSCHQKRHHELRQLGIAPKKHVLLPFPKSKKEWFTEECLMEMLERKRERNGYSPSILRNFIWQLTGKRIKARYEPIVLSEEIKS